MKYLLDSHIILWALTDYEVLPEDIQSIISDKENEIYYSLASIWEVTIKWIKSLTPTSSGGLRLAPPGQYYRVH